MKDEFLACCSDLGLINGGKSWQNGCVLPDCTLDEPKLIEILATGTKDGANCHRELYSWSVALSDVDANPFIYDYDANDFDLSLFNEPYFKMLTRFGKLVNKYRGPLIFDPYDICGTKNKKNKPKRTPFNPWTNNKQGIKGFWDPKAAKYRKAWEDKLDKSLKGVSWIPTIGNELDRRCIDQGKQTLLNFISKKRFYFFKKHKVIYHGFLHNTDKTSDWWQWHRWQKKNWYLDEHVGEVWHLAGTKKKMANMGRDAREIPVTPHTFFSIDGLNNQEMSISNVVDIIKPLNKVKDTGKSKMFFKKKPVIEVLNYSNTHITLALDKIHFLLFGRHLANLGKKFDIPEPVVPPVVPPEEPIEPLPEPEPPKPEPQKPSVLIWINDNPKIMYFGLGILFLLILILIF